ncbi:2-succinyl-6-hydroxy-2,4-cyclohexadiene-1-carboxylate synthase [Neobacillus sp. PS3-34]|uniref:2-succinyl-6-hydroxy-2, 4-cyclohexadiene-1-carboxylate synthase n=1 Tax=Neobacillus sp. PS3-34 TaxID=3070678 RepID=UPI0027DED874|nr:2-succinyl-6-hydroxy-2,4-cyclohexadiene-1-carboxylate synthase [Neobacillus sp. PS3-34]WML47231.1 2-succinyl-6-hydroxy-2,4-cyclohexadiene-1-carboxylate synthase [Neobacillus sp. PS3-34]
MNIVVDGIDHHVELCGDGFPLLLLHGFTGSGSTWMPFCERWGRHSRLIMPDIIGHGKTDSPVELERYSIQSVARDLNEILNKLNVEKTDLLGYSMGGRLALTFALLYPDRVRKLVLVSASPGLSSENDREIRRMNDANLANFIIEEGVPAFVSRWESIPLFKSMEQLPQSVNAAIRAQRLQNSSNGLSNSLIGMGTGSQPSWWQHLKDLSCEVLLVTGSMDEKFCLIAENMQNMIKNVSWMSIIEGGHAIHVEKSEIFGTIVSEFLSNTY